MGEITESNWISGPKWAHLGNALLKSQELYNVKIKITREDRGWFRETVFFTITGEPNDVVEWSSAIIETANKRNKW